jgi:NADPH2:quinone reductase
VSKGLQEYALLDEDFAAKIPEGVDEHGAATIPTNLFAGKSFLIPSSIPTYK